MVEINIADGTLHLEVRGLDKLWALKSRLEIPLQHVRGVDRNAEEAGRIWKGLRAPGTHIPGVITAGSFYHHGNWVFWDVHDEDRAIVVHLRDERYERLVVEVADPDATVRLIEAGLAQRSAP